MPNKSITFVIPTCNRPNDLQRCLEMLIPQFSEESDVEVLVCDDSKNGDTKQLIEKSFANVRWLQGPQRGAATNRNFGARSATGDWLIFIDDDCLPRPSLFSAYKSKIQELDDSAFVAIEGATYPLSERESMLWEAPYNIDGGSFISCNFAMPRKVFLDLKGFDERFPHDFEDMEFAARSQAQGLKLLFVKEAAVDHPLRPTPPSKKLAYRWESRVISSYDFGAKPWQVMFYLPRHVLLVIASRFRKIEWNAGNRKAILLFAGEFLIFLQRLPFWCRYYNRRPRSTFWTDPAHAAHVPRRFGL